VTSPAEAPAADHFEVKLDAAAMKATSAQGSLLFGSAQIFRMLLQLGSQVALARLLFPSDFGLVAMVYPVINFVTIFNIGFGEALVQRSQLQQDRVSTLFWLSMAMSCVIALILMAAAPVTALIYREPRITLLMMVIASFVPIFTLGGVQGSLLTRHMKFKVIVAIDVATAIVGTVVTVVTAWLGWSYWSLAAGNFAVAVSGTALNWLASDWRPSRPRHVAEVMDDLKFGSNITGINLATFLTTSGDNIIIGLVNGEQALGLYDRSYRLVVAPVVQILAPIGRVAVPLLSRLNDDPDEYRKVFLVMVHVIVGLTVPGMLVCVIHGREVVHVLLGPRWTEASDILSWISVSGLTSGMQAAALWLFVSQGRMRGMRHVTIATSVLNLASFALGSIWGIKGVAIAVGLTFSLLNTPIIIFGATRQGPVGAAPLLRACVPYVAAGAVSAGLLLALERVAMPSAIVRIIIALAITYGVFAATTLTSPEERRRVLALLRALRKSRA
jgi:PST family polysaccharide transporter